MKYTRLGTVRIVHLFGRRLVIGQLALPDCGIIITHKIRFGKWLQVKIIGFVCLHK